MVGDTVSSAGDARERLARARHDLRTPINGIIGYSELIQEEALDKQQPELAAQMELLRACGKDLLGHVNSLMAETRFAAMPTVDPRAIAVDLRAAMAPGWTKVAADAEQLMREAPADAVAADLQKIKMCAGQLEALVNELAGAAPAAGPAVAPAAEVSRPDATPQTATPKAPATAAILVVEDDPSTRELLARHLAKMGYAVTEAENGARGLALMRGAPFDLVMLDLHMPEMNGFQVLAAMKANPALRGVPVIVVSGLEDMESVIRCIKLGAIDHLSKPFDAVLLRVRVRAALAIKQLRDEEVVPARDVRRRTTAAAAPAGAPEPPPGLGVFGFLRCLSGWMLPYRSQAILFGVGLAASMSIAAALPLGFKYLTDYGLVPHDFRALIIILAILVGAEIVSAGLDLGRDFFFSRFTAKLLNDIRLSLFRHLQRLSLGYYGRVSPGEVIGRFTIDLESVDGAVTNFLSTVLCQFVLVPVSLALLCALDWRLALISALGMYMSFKSERWFEPRAEAASHRLKEQQAKIATVLQENVQAQPVVKMFRLQGLLIERFKHQMLDFYRTAARACFLLYLTYRAPNRTAGMFGLLTLAAGAFLVYYDRMTVGTLVSFQLMQAGLLTAVSDLMWGVPQLLQAGVGLQRIEGLLNQKPDVEDPSDCLPCPRPAKQIELANVRFGYSCDRLNLIDVSLKIPMGHSVLLVGPSGCGKSTVLNLLMRFYDPAGGVISIDGRDIRTVAQDALRSHMSVVFQESFLFNTSIRENILLGNREATDEEIQAAAKLAEIHEAIMKMPEGYDTLVGDRGGKLSGGQRQRIAIARAILSNPAILLLDEATSALDPTTAAAVSRTLERIAEGRTVISATHRLETAPRADCVFVFRDGRLVEHGCHDDLLRLDGLYAQLWRQQAGA
jgi:ATP-binding cassette subfamily B protein